LQVDLLSLTHPPSSEQVLKTVNRVLDILEIQGHLYRSSTQAKRPRQGEKVKLTRREHILKEMIETERDYVHHLQNLQALQKELLETGAVNGDSSHQIFLNLNNLVDFAQRFLIRMEQHYALSEEQQNWGELFVFHQEGFRQYEPFIANQLRCDEICQKEWDKIHSAPRSSDLQQMVAQQSTLNSFFVKPFQRLTKYPLMLMVRLPYLLDWLPKVAKSLITDWHFVRFCRNSKSKPTAKISRPTLAMPLIRSSWFWIEQTKQSTRSIWHRPSSI
jgi:hypothetical protein